MHKINEINNPFGRSKYPFARMDVGDIVTLPKSFEVREKAVLARCAAHTVAYAKGWRFKIKIRENDAGKFELKAERIK